MEVVDSHFSKAWDLTTSAVVDIKNLPKIRNGANCQCICVECKRPLEACQGSIRKWYFRHQSKTGCNGGPMTAIHLLAQQILEGKNAIKTISGAVEYDLGRREFSIPRSSFRADVGAVKSSGEIFLIEILVTHHVDPIKRDHIHAQRIHAIEIDLRKVSPSIDEEYLREILLTNTRLQKVIFDPAANIAGPIKEPASLSAPWYEDIIPIGLAIAIGYCFWRLVKPKAGRKTRR